MPTVDSETTFASGGPVGGASPDSLAFASGDLWVAYTNGADSTGAAGSSTVVEYSPTGAVLQTFTLAGYVDGLKLDPYTHQVWAMQNQDGNSTLTTIDPKTGVVSSPLTYADPSATQGYDDVVFQGSKVYLSRTNPTGPGEATLVSLTGGGRDLDGPLATTPVLLSGATGLDTVTGQMEVIPQNDPDSLKAGLSGDLLFTSGDDGVIIDIHHVGKSNQSVTFTPIQGVTAGSAGLDDVIQTHARAGTFYISDTNDNRVVAVHVSDLNSHDYYATVGSLNAFGEVDPTTGVFTPLLTAANAPGMTFSGPHGITFVADPAQRAGTPPPRSIPHALVASIASFGGGAAAADASHPEAHAAMTRLALPSAMA